MGRSSIDGLVDAARNKKPGYRNAAQSGHQTQEFCNARAGCQSTGSMPRLAMTVPRTNHIRADRAIRVGAGR